MPNQRGVKTPQERAFIEAYAATMDAQESAKRAGYASPHSAGYLALKRPAIREEIVRLQLERLDTELLPLAVDTLASIMKDTKSPAGARVTAAKIVLDKRVTDATNGKQPHEMTGEELARAIDELTAIASGKAKPIDAVVIEDAEPSILD